MFIKLFWSWVKLSGHSLESMSLSSNWRANRMKLKKRTVIAQDLWVFCIFSVNCANINWVVIPNKNMFMYRMDIKIRSKTVISSHFLKKIKVLASYKSYIPVQTVLKAPNKIFKIVMKQYIERLWHLRKMLPFYVLSYLPLRSSSFLHHVHFCSTSGLYSFVRTPFSSPPERAGLRISACSWRWGSVETTPLWDNLRGNQWFAIFWASLESIHRQSQWLLLILK